MEVSKIAREAGVHSSTAAMNDTSVGKHYEYETKIQEILQPFVDDALGTLETALAIAEELKEVCNEKGGSAMIPDKIKADLTTVGRILNIGWVERGLETEARLICSRGGVCPRKPVCPNACK